MNWKLFTAGALAVVAVLSVLYYNGFFLERSTALGRAVQQSAAAIGVSLGIEENEHSRIAQQLQERAEELDNRERSLNDLEQEIVQQMAEERRSERRIFLYISLVAGALLALIGANFYYDVAWRRKRREERDANNIRQ